MLSLWVKHPLAGCDFRGVLPLIRLTMSHSAHIGNLSERVNVSMGMETTWMATGNCNNHPPAVFFPSDGVGVEVAKKICATCPVKEQCLEYALEARIDHGVWGGASERQRRRLLKQRRVALRRPKVDA